MATGFLISTASAIALGITYWAGGQTQLEGLFLATALAGLGIGFILWSKRFMPHEPVVEARHPIASSEEEVDAFREEFEQGENILTRRKLLIRSAGAAVIALGAALLFPIRSLGPRPGKGLKTTPFEAGVHVVTETNARVRPADINLNGVLTVFPEVPQNTDAEGEDAMPAAQADAATLLIRPNQPIDPVEGREGWTQDGIIAYSKICTHVGCPVGLYEAQEHLLLCPCHQSTFDVLDGAEVVFGPAGRPLPQLPLGPRRRRVPRRRGRLLQPDRARLLGPGPLMAGNRMVTRRVARWIDERTGSAKFARTALGQGVPRPLVVPDRRGRAVLARSSCMATGVYLTFFFDPSVEEVVYDGSYVPLQGVTMSQAYSSALDISFDVRAGLVMRQMHHWAALLFLAAIVVHLMRIFFTGAFRRPRELNWMVGVTLLILAIFNGFAGYSLLDDQLSGTGLRIAYSITLSIPVAGTWLASLLFGGEFPGPDIINRLYVIHILLLPAAIIGLLVVHLGLVVRHKHTQFGGRGRTEKNVVGEPVWPRFAFKSIGLMLCTAAVTAALGGLAQINPVWLYGPYKVSNVSSASQPDWYMGWLDGALRVFPGWETRAFGYEIPGAFYAGVVLAGITFGLLYAWPFLESKFTNDHVEHHLLDRPRNRPVRTCMGAATLAFYALLTLSGSTDVLATTFGLSVNVVLDRLSRRPHRRPPDRRPHHLPAVPRAAGPRRGGRRGPARATRDPLGAAQGLGVAGPAQGGALRRGRPGPRRRRSRGRTAVD